MSQQELTARLTRIFRDKNQKRRARDLMSLRDHRPLETLDAIISLFGFPELDIRRRAGKSLHSFRGLLQLRGIVLAEHLVQNEDSHIRLSCAVALMNNPAAPVTRAYRRALGDSFDKVAEIACQELGRRGGSGSTEALMRTLGSRSWCLRLEACKALITQGTADGRVVGALEVMARETEALIYDAECDRFEAMERQLERETDEPLPWGHSWGKLETILSHARCLANLESRTKPSASRKGGTASNNIPSTRPNGAFTGIALKLTCAKHQI